MNLRDRFLKSITKKSNDYIPKNISLCPAQLDRFEKEYGHRDYLKEWNIPVRTVELKFTRVSEDFSRWHENVNELVYFDEWGIGHERSRGAYHFERLLHPLMNAQTVEDIEEYPFPLPSREEEVKEAIKKVEIIKNDGYAAIVPVCPVGGTVFWPCYKLRGMENFLCDLYINKDIANSLINKVTSICVEQAKLAAAIKPDIIHMADDLGTQQSTYMSPELFREWIKPSLKRVINAAKEVYPEVLINFHSDGAIQQLIPDLIEIGVDILNPIQPECMDPLVIYEQYGDKLALHGCIGTQTTLPFGTVNDVKNTVRKYCDIMGKKGGLWIAPTHVIEPEVPWENIMAFIETADEYS